MNFLAPYMLWGAAAASIPIVLHFLFRSRYRTVPWAAMKFLLTSIEQTSRRLRFQELLLLLVRISLLVLLALALARPFSTVGGGGGKGDAVDAVFFIDTSFSMGVRDGNSTCLQKARSAALKVIDQLPPHSTVQIVTCSDQARLLGPRQPANLDQARKIIEDLQLEHLASDLLPGLAESASVLESGQASNKEFYLFSDMHQLGWNRQGKGVDDLLKNIKDRAAVYLVRCSRGKVHNVAVIGITPQSGIPRPGERIGFAVLVRNSGNEPVRNLSVSLSVDEKDPNQGPDDPKKTDEAPKQDDDQKKEEGSTRESQPISLLSPGETRAVTLTAPLAKPGLRILTARVKHDDLEADNCYHQILLVRDQVNVLVVDGAPNLREPHKSASYYLEHALQPVKNEAERLKYYLQVTNVSPRQATPARLAKQNLVVLTNVALQPDPKKPNEYLAPDFVEELARFVHRGHGLMIFAGDHVNPESYNRILGDKHNLLPLKIKGLRKQSLKEPLFVDRQSVGLPAFTKFKEDDYFKGIAAFPIFQTLDLEEHAGKKKKDQAGTDSKAVDDAASVVDSGPQVILRYQDGKPMVASKKFGNGEVMLFATSADPGWQAKDPNPAWNYWPVFPEFMYLPFMDVAVAHLLHGQGQNHNWVAGQTFYWHPPEKELHSYTLVHPGNHPVRLDLPRMVQHKPDAQARGQDRPELKITDLPRAGIYYLLAGKPPGADQAPAEPVVDINLAREKGIPFAVVPDLRESEDLQTLSDEVIDERLGFKPIHATVGENPGNFAEVERLNREWTPWIIVLVILLALGEIVLAWWCGKAV